MQQLQLLNSERIFLPQTQVLIFGTNIDSDLKVKIVKSLLSDLVGVKDVSVDREDWERILRVECSSETSPEMVYAKVRNMGFRCYELEE